VEFLPHWIVNPPGIHAKHICSGLGCEPTVHFLQDFQGCLWRRLTCSEVKYVANVSIYRLHSHILRRSPFGSIRTVRATFASIRLSKTSIPGRFPVVQEIGADTHRRCSSERVTANHRCELARSPFHCGRSLHSIDDGIILIVQDDSTELLLDPSFFGLSSASRPIKSPFAIWTQNPRPPHRDSQGGDVNREVSVTLFQPERIQCFVPPTPS